MNLLRTGTPLGGVLLCLAACSHADIQRSPLVTIGDEVPWITMARTECYGVCPSYVVSVFRDGRVVYIGRTFVAAVGPRERPAPPEEMEALQEAVDYAALWRTSSGCCSSRDSTDAPSAEIEITENGSRKRIEIYYGSASIPGRILRLADQIDRVLNTRVWVEGYRVFESCTNSEALEILGRGQEAVRSFCATEPTSALCAREPDYTNKIKAIDITDANAVEDTDAMIKSGVDTRTRSSDPLVGRRLNPGETGELQSCLTLVRFGQGRIAQGLGLRRRAEHYRRNTQDGSPWCRDVCLARAQELVALGAFEQAASCLPEKFGTLRGQLIAARAFAERCAATTQEACVCEVDGPSAPGNG